MPASCSAATVAAKFGERVAARVACLRGEEAQRVVAPVIAQAAVGEMAVIEKGMDRQQLDRGDAELAQVRDHARLGQRTVGAAHVRRHVLRAAASGL